VETKFCDPDAFSNRHLSSARLFLGGANYAWPSLQPEYSSASNRLLKNKILLQALHARRPQCMEFQPKVELSEATNG